MEGAGGCHVLHTSRQSRIHDSGVPKASAVVTAVRRHVSAGAVDQAFALLYVGLRELLRSAAAEPVTGGKR